MHKQSAIDAKVCTILVQFLRPLQDSTLAFSKEAQSLPNNKCHVYINQAFPLDLPTP